MVENKIIVRGARVHNLKNVDVEIPRGSLTVFTDLAAPASRRLPLTQSMRKDNDAILRHFPLTHETFSAEWNAPMWTKCKD